MESTSDEFAMQNQCIDAEVGCNGSMCQCTYRLICFCEDVHASGSILGIPKTFETMFAHQSSITTATKTGKRSRFATAFQIRSRAHSSCYFSVGQSQNQTEELSKLDDAW